MNTLNIYKDKEILVTGGLGFIGSTLAYKLVDLGAKVTLMDAMIPSYGGNKFNIAGIEDKVKVVVADVREHSNMDRLIKDKEYLFNLAGTLSHVDSMTDPFTDLEINCRSQLAILESCRKHNPKVKIIFTATRGEYGRAQYLPVDEKHPLDPTDVNGINKIAGENYHLLYHKVHGIPATSLRLTNTFGPRHQMKHHKQGIINWFVRQAIEGQKIKLFGDGGQVRDCNYVDDVVDALLLAGSNDKAFGQIYNLGGIPASLQEIVKLLIKIIGFGSFELIPFPPDSKKIEIGDYKADHSKITAALGWQPKTALEEGLKKTVEYYQKYRRHYW